VTLAASKGYTQAVADGVRDRFRHLRHDLRNPLGTIKSVLALMDDESMPVDARSHPKFRAMAKRNARSLEEMIVARLGDAGALVPTLSHQQVSLRTVACSVRRDLRAEAESRHVAVLVSDVRVHACVDAVNLELLLHTTMLAALQEAAKGDSLMIDFELRQGANHAIVRLAVEPERPLLAGAVFERLRVQAEHMGVRVTADERGLALSIPVRATPRAAAAGPVDVECAVEAPLTQADT
jgi:light-regulated signal transduction histidine kinase (bacteriophytochrome)